MSVLNNNLFALRTNVEEVEVRNASNPTKL